MLRFFPVQKDWPQCETTAIMYHHVGDLHQDVPPVIFYLSWRGRKRSDWIVNVLTLHSPNSFFLLLTKISPFVPSAAAKEEEEYFPWYLWHQVWSGAHAEAGSVQAANTQDEGPEEEEGRGGRRRGQAGCQSVQSGEVKLREQIDGRVWGRLSSMCRFNKIPQV